jgi:PAS domain-containing protein
MVRVRICALRGETLIPAIRAHRRLVAETAFGLCVSLLALAAASSLHLLAGGRYFMPLTLTAVAIACWYRGMRAGVAAALTGVIGLCMFAPRLHSLHAQPTTGAVRLVVFCLTATLICAIAWANERNSTRLSLIETKFHEAEQWMDAAQQSTRFWTWEIDPDRRLIQWNDPYGELRTRVYEPVDSWLLTIHPDDRARCEAALDEATSGNRLALEFRMNGPEGERSLVAKGALVTNSATSARRLIGVIVERSANDSALLDSYFALFGVTEVLATLADSPDLDRRARRNVHDALKVVAALLPQPVGRPSAAGGVR